jgi:hypothetical protein
MILSLNDSKYCIVYSELLKALSEKCQAEYHPISWCGGVIILAKGEKL